MQQIHRYASRTVEIDIWQRSLLRTFGSLIVALSLLCTAANTANARALMPDYAQLVQEQGPTVVKITASKTRKARNDQQPSPFDQMPDELRRYFEQMPGVPGGRPQPSQGMGSGFIISDDGYIVTNHHVIVGADDIVVDLQNRDSFDAELIGSDPRTDLALLKIDATDLPVARLGDSDALKVGQWVLAIGSPFGFDYTATQGIISALSRSLPSSDSNYVPFIQTDVAVNPGNSGGPLFDLDGQVVGVNAQIYSSSGGYMGLSFAIPSNVVKHVTAQLRENGRVSRGWLGVTIQEIDQGLAESFGMDHPHGALVAEVVAGSPAAAAGIEPGDVIVRFNGREIARSGDLPPVVGTTPVGEAVTVDVIRGGEATELSVTIGELDEQVAANDGDASPGSSGALAGMQVAPAGPEQLESLGVTAALVVESVDADSAAAEAGVRSGDLLLSLNRQTLDSVATLREILADAPGDKPLPLLVARGGGRLYLPLSPAN